MTKKVFSKRHTFYKFYGKTWRVCHHFTASSCGSKHQIGQVTMNGSSCGSKHQIGQVTMNGKKKYMLYTVLLCPSSKGLYSLERTITIMYNIFPSQSCQNYRITLVPEHAPLAVVLVLPPWFITVVSYKWGIGQKWSWKTFKIMCKFLYSTSLHYCLSTTNDSRTDWCGFFACLSCLESAQMTTIPIINRRAICSTLTIWENQNTRTKAWFTSYNLAWPKNLRDTRDVITYFLGFLIKLRHTTHLLVLSIVNFSTHESCR